MSPVGKNCWQHREHWAALSEGSRTEGRFMGRLAIPCILLSAMAGTGLGATKSPPKKLSVDLGDGVKMEMVLVPAGDFLMGSAESAKEAATFFKKDCGDNVLTADDFKD